MLLVATAAFSDDAVPPNATGTFILIGPEEARDQSDKSGAGAEHQMVISVITDATGFLSIKTIAAAISDALIGMRGVKHGKLTVTSAGHL